MKKKCEHNRNGYTLLLVLLVMTVLSILSLSIFNLFQANTRQIVIQENNLRAHYLARSGIDIAYAAMMTSTSSGGMLKINKLIDDKATIEHKNLELPKTNPIGKVDIKISYIVAKKEVAINAKAKLIDGTGDSELTLYIQYDEADKSNFTRTRWSRN